MRTWLIVGALLTVGGIGALIIHAQNTPVAQLRAYTDTIALPEAAAPRMDEAAALRRYFYYARHKLDPLFAIPGTEPDTLADALEQFQESTRDALTHLSEEERERIADQLYPFDFLMHLPDAEQARRALLRNPSNENIQRYHRILLETIGAYRKALDVAQGALAAINPEKQLVFPAGIANIAHLSAQLEAARAAAETRRADETERFQCFEGDMAACKRQLTHARAAHYATVAALEVTTAPEPTPHTLVVDGVVNALMSNVSTRQTFARTHDSLDAVPLVTLESSVCTPQHTPTFLKTWWSPSRVSSEVDAVFVEPVNDLFVYDLEKTPGSYYQALYEVGVPYKLQLRYYPYMCIDFMHDYGRVLSTLYIHDYLTSHPIFRDSNAAPEPIAATEAQFIEMYDVLPVGSVANFLADAQQLLHERGESQFARDFSAERLAHLVHLLHVWEARSPWLADVIGLLDDTNLSTDHVTHFQNIPPEAFTLSRGYFSALFLLSNRTIVERPRSLLTEHTPMPWSDFNLISVSDPVLQAAFPTPSALATFLIESGAKVRDITKHAQ